MEGEVIDTLFHADRRPQGHFKAVRSTSTLLGEHPPVGDGWQAVLLGFSQLELAAKQTDDEGGGCAAGGIVVLVSGTGNSNTRTLAHG